MKRLICCKVLLLILLIGFSCCSVYGKNKLSKTEKQALKWLEKGEKLDNGVVRIILPGDHLSMLHDDNVVETIKSRSMLIWKAAGSRNVYYYCIPFENIASLFPGGLLSGIDYPMTKGCAMVYDGRFKFEGGLNWFGKVEDGLLEGKGYGFSNSDKNNYIFYGEFTKGIPVGDFYCVNPNGESIYKDAKRFKASLATPIVKVSAFNSGWAKIMERTSKGYVGAYMDAKFNKVMTLDDSGVRSLFQNVGQSFSIVDFSEFKNNRATISFSYRYNMDEKPRGVLKMEIDEDLAFAGFLPESDKEVTAILDRIIAAQVKVLNPTGLKAPDASLKKLGVEARDYAFCNRLSSVLGKSYEGSKKYNKSTYNPTLIQASPHISKRLEMAMSLFSIFNWLSDERFINLKYEANKGHLKKSGIDEEWLSKRLSEDMTKIRSLAPDPIFPKITTGGLKALENKINSVNKSFLAAYYEAYNINNQVLAKKAERRNRNSSNNSNSSYNEIDWNNSKEPSGKFMEPSIISTTNYASYQYDGKIVLKGGKGTVSYNIYFEKEDGQYKPVEYRVRLGSSLKMDKFTFKTRDEMLDAISKASHN